MIYCDALTTDDMFHAQKDLSAQTNKQMHADARMKYSHNDIYREKSK